MVIQMHPVYEPNLCSWVSWQIVLNNTPIEKRITSNVGNRAPQESQILETE